VSYPELLSTEEKLADAKERLGIRDVVVLCGSMRFADQMAEVAIVESVGGADGGALVLKPDCNLKHPHPLWADPSQAEALKARLDDQHRQKIRLADRVIVVGDYIGDSTRGEIAYARELGKPVTFTDPTIAGQYGADRGEITMSHTNPVPGPAARPQGTEQPTADTLPEWLHNRFGPHLHGGDFLPWALTEESDRSYWEHQAAAVRRAVARGGFKTPAGGEQV
jgi:hypothetical protein